MDDVQEILVQKLQANGGSMLYANLIDGVEYQHRMHVPNVLRRMRNAGIAQRIVARNPESGQVEFTVRLVGG